MRQGDKERKRQELGERKRKKGRENHKKSYIKE